MKWKVVMAILGALLVISSTLNTMGISLNDPSIQVNSHCGGCFAPDKSASQYFAKS